MSKIFNLFFASILILTLIGCPAFYSGRNVEQVKTKGLSIHNMCADSISYSLVFNDKIDDDIYLKHSTDVIKLGDKDTRTLYSNQVERYEKIFSDSEYLEELPFTNNFFLEITINNGKILKYSGIDLVNPNHFEDEFIRSYNMIYDSMASLEITVCPRLTATNQ